MYDALFKVKKLDDNTYLLCVDISSFSKKEEDKEDKEKDISIVSYDDKYKEFSCSNKEELISKIQILLNKKTNTMNKKEESFEEIINKMN